MTTPTLLQAAQDVVTIFKRVRSDMPLDVLTEVKNLEQAIEREEAKPRNEAEVLNDLTPTRRSCVTCKFEHYDKIEAPCLPCRFYSNWEPKP